MSRHRNVRNYAYEDDMSDDVYGHSVEDHDMCISPSTAHQFMYNRNNEDHKRNVFGHYMDTRFGSVEEQVEEEEQSEEEDLLSHSQDYRRPQLDPVSQAKLSSCLDQLQSILGDDCHEPTAVEAIIKFDFDAEKALDYIFEKGNNKASSKQTKKSDSILCHNISRKSVPSVTMLSSLSSEHTTPTQLHSNQNTDTLSSLLSEPLNAIVDKGRPTNKSFSNFQNESNNESSLLGLSLKSLAEKGELSKRDPHSMTDNELMASSLFSLANLSVSDFSGGTKPTKCDTESDLMSKSLSSLTNQNENKGMTKWPDKNENTTKSSLFTTSLSSLASQNFHGKVPRLQETSKTNNFSETSLMSVPLSSLTSDSHLPKTEISPFDVVTFTSLSSLAKQNDLTLLPLNLLDNSKPEAKTLLGTSSLTNEGNKGTFPENSSSASRQDLNNELLETSLSALSLSSLTCKKDVEKPSLSSFGLESIVFKEGTNDELQITAHKETKQSKHHDSAKKSYVLSKEITARKAKKHRTRTKQNPLMRVKPSMFAFTICHSAKRRCDVTVSCSLPKRLGSMNRYFGLGNIVPFDFQTPSPDDIIQMKQKKGFSR